MGNRAVITTKAKKLGVYLHWNGGRDSVEAFLQYCKIKGYRSPETDSYGWARLSQVIGNFFGGTASIGLDTLDKLDTNNYDNGTYIIEDWEIVGRMYSHGEQQQHDLVEMLVKIDESQPVIEQLGREYFSTKEVNTSELKVNDIVFVMGHGGKVSKEKIIGIGGSKIDEYGKLSIMVNGSDMKGVPYIDKYGNGENARNNINNYLRELSYKKAN